MPKPRDPMTHENSAGTAHPTDTNGVVIRDFDRSLPMALLRAREAVMDRFRPTLRSFGVTEQQWRVLRALSDLDETDVTSLAERCCILAPSLTRILRDLTARKLVARRTTEKDLRIGLISITPAGRKLIADVGPHSEIRYREIADRVGAEDLNQLYRLLDRLEARLRQDAGNKDGRESGGASIRRAAATAE